MSLFDINDLRWLDPSWRRKTSMAERIEIVKDYLEFKSYHAVAKTWGVSASSVRQYVLNMANYGHSSLRHRVATQDKAMPNRKIKSALMDPDAELPKDLEASHKMIRQQQIAFKSLLESIDNNLGGTEGSKKVVLFDEAVTRSHQAGLPLTKSCDVFKVARCSYYRRLGEYGSRVRKDQELGDRIKRIQAAHDGRYGILRMTAALKEDGHERKPGHNQVARVMREIGCQAVVRRACTYRVRCKKGQLPDGTVLENVLDRKFEQPKPRTAFVTDVTYIPVKEG